MWIYSLLIPLCLLGATAAQPFYFDGGHQHPRGFAALDDSEAVVKTFLDKMTKTIESKDSGAIADLFAEDFFFKGCKGDYDKSKIVALVGKLPAGTAFSFTFKSAKYLSADKIDYSVIISGFGPTPVEAQFLLCAKTGKLSGGSVPACKRTHFHEFSSKEKSREMVQNFIEKSIKSLKRRLINVIGELFESEFNFYGCKDTYVKHEVVNVLAYLPAKTKFNITLVDFADHGSTISFLASIGGVEDPGFVAELVLNKTSQKLVVGSKPACKMLPHLSFIGHSFQSPDADIIVKKFIERMSESIGNKMTGHLFAEIFVFTVCNRTYDKFQTTTILNKLPLETKISIQFISAKFISTEMIEFIVSFTGFGTSPVTAQFTLSATFKKLQSGFLSACHKSEFHSQIRRETAQQMVNKFVVRLHKAVKSKDVASISGLFESGFLFTGCSDRLNKDQIVAVLAQYPDEGGLFLSVQSVEDLGSSIRFRAVTDGSEKTRMSADFILNKSSQQLKSIIFPVCSIPKNFVGASRFNVASDATNIITEMLVILKQTIAKHDSSAIGQLFDVNFVFKGCHGTYNKAETLAKIAQVPKEANFYFALKSANWNKEGQIEYTVTISGALLDDFDAQFVYCPYRHVLKSGSISSCPAKRMFAKPCLNDLGLFC
ncbi:unnamed protein product [Caenorhabditis brenneri]